MADFNSGAFWERVNRLCKTTKVTQEKLCTDLGFNIGSYKNRIVRSIAPDVFDAQKIAFYFGVSVEFLVTGKDFNTLSEDRSELIETTYKKKYENLKKLILNSIDSSYAELKKSVINGIEEN